MSGSIFKKLKKSCVFYEQAVLKYTNNLQFCFACPPEMLDWAPRSDQYTWPFWPWNHPILQVGDANVSVWVHVLICANAINVHAHINYNQLYTEYDHLQGVSYKHRITEWTDIENLGGHLYLKLDIIMDMIMMDISSARKKNAHKLGCFFFGPGDVH